MSLVATKTVVLTSVGIVTVEGESAAERFTARAHLDSAIAIAEGRTPTYPLDSFTGCVVGGAPLATADDVSRIGWGWVASRKGGE